MIINLWPKQISGRNLPGTIDCTRYLLCRSKIYEYKRYPRIEDGLIIFSGAKIIGGVTIGKKSIVGANAVVNKLFPERSVLGGCIRYNRDFPGPGIAVSYFLDIL